MSDENEKIDIDAEIIEIGEIKEPKKILMIITNTDHFDETHKTGVTFEEFAKPYLDFLKEGYIVTVASPKGGISPIDPASENLFNDIKWQEAKKALNDTVKLDTVDYTLYDAIVLPGGHGPMFDLAHEETMKDIIKHFSEHHKLIAAICHGPAGFIPAVYDGIPFVNGRKLTCFSNDEEIKAKKDNLLPFFLEDKLKEQGAFYNQKDDGEINVIEDDNLITAQNQQSSEQFAQAIIRYFDEN